MRRSVRWSGRALDDLEAQIGYIAARNPKAASRVADAIRDTVGRLGEMPTGRPGRVAGTREKPVARLPYIIAYIVTTGDGGDVLTVLRVIHTARDWPGGLWPG